MSQDYFSYNDGKGIIKPGDFRISPSQISRFFDDTNRWYREFLLGEAGFQGSTATELGNVVHAAAAMYIDSKSVDRQQLINHVNSIKNPEIDKSVINSQYQVMIETLINGYLSENVGTNSEEFIWKEIYPGIGVGGSVDMYNANTHKITDFKTMGSLDKARLPSKFPRAYWFQQLVYAWVTIQNGRPVDFIELAYVTRSNVNRTNDKGKPLKDYPSVVHVIREAVTAESLALIESVIYLIADSVKTWQTQPELRYLLAQDYRLKQPPAAVLFKD